MELGSPLLTHFGLADASAPRILVLPALGTPARTYRRLGEALAELRMAGAVLEWPGNGAHPIRADRQHDWGYQDLLGQQVLPAVEQLAGSADDDDPRPVVLIGHSLGAHLALMARARGARALSGVILIAAGTPYYRVFHFPARQALLYLIAAVRLVTPLLGYFPGQRLGFGGREPRGLILEWAEFARHGQLLGRDNQVLRAAPQTPAIPVRAFSLPRDVYAPAAAASHLLACAGLPASAVERVSDPALHGHFHWLRAPQAAARLIADCLGKFTPAPGAPASPNRPGSR